MNILTTEFAVFFVFKKIPFYRIYQHSYINLCTFFSRTRILVSLVPYTQKFSSPKNVSEILRGYKGNDTS